MERASEYLIVLYVEERRRSPPIPPRYVADAVDRSPSTVTETLQRLDARGYVDHEPYEGATLTPEGREVAADLYDRYVTLSRFFRDVLGLEAHDAEARRLAASVSSTVTDRLRSTLLGEASDEGPVEGRTLPVDRSDAAPGRAGTGTRSTGGDE